MRFLFPVYYIHEVELNPSTSTSTQTIAIRKCPPINGVWSSTRLFLSSPVVRTFLESMDKVLYFRSSSDPLILTEEQRDVRRKSRRISSHITTQSSSPYSDRIESLKKTSDILVVRGQTLPDLTSSAFNRIKHANSRHELGKQSHDLNH